MLKKTIVLLLFFIIVAGLIIQNIKLLGDDNKIKVTKITIENCSSHKKECITEIDEFKIGILFDENIYYLKPFNVEIWIKSKDDIDIESVKINFKMKNMNMGINHFILKKINFRDKKQKWQGKALLPVCVTGRVDWYSEIEVVTKESKYIISLPILVKQFIN